MLTIVKRYVVSERLRLIKSHGTR